MGSGKGAGHGHRPLLWPGRTFLRSSFSQAWTRAQGPRLSLPTPGPACSPALRIQLPLEPSKASLSQGASLSLLPASQRGSRLRKRLWTEVGFGIRATGKTSCCRRQGLSSLTPGHLSVGGGHPGWDQAHPEGCCPLPALRPAGVDREQSTVRGVSVLGWAAAAPCGWPAEVQREPVTAMPVDFRPSRAFQQRSSTSWYRSCFGQARVSLFYTSSLFLLLLWNHVCKGRWTGTDSPEPGTGIFTSKPENSVLLLQWSGVCTGSVLAPSPPNAVILVRLPNCS